MTGMLFKRPSPLQKHLNELITKLKNSREYKQHRRNFISFIDKKDLTTTPTTFYLYFDLDDLEYKIAMDLVIPHNSLVLAKSVVPSKHEKNVDKAVEDYQFEWSKT